MIILAEHMSDQDESIDVVDVDRMQDGVIVTFSNGASALFHSQFLFDRRDHHSNVGQEKRGEDGHVKRSC